MAHCLTGVNLRRLVVCDRRKMRVKDEKAHAPSRRAASWAVARTLTETRHAHAQTSCTGRYRLRRPGTVAGGLFVKHRRARSRSRSASAHHGQAWRSRRSAAGTGAIRRAGAIEPQHAVLDLPPAGSRHRDRARSVAALPRRRPRRSPSLRLARLRHRKPGACRTRQRFQGRCPLRLDRRRRRHHMAGRDASVGIPTVSCHL